jgi:hypothetical protein
MKFLINTFNQSHLGERSLEDPIAIVGHQLAALGHSVAWANDRFLMPDVGINIVTEGFSPQSTQSISLAHSHGARFICLATEEPTPRGFNHGYYAEWVSRQNEFPKTAKCFEGILYLVPGTGEWYSQFAPAAHIELGYADTLMRVDETIEPTHDFGFFGSWTEHRREVCERLTKMVGVKPKGEKAVIFISNFSDQLTRDKEMEKARVILQLKRRDEMGVVSSTRCNTALCLGRPVIAEPHEYSKPWDGVVRFSETPETFFRDAMAMRDAWKEEYAAQFARFRSKFTPEFCVGRALKEINLNMETISATSLYKGHLITENDGRFHISKDGFHVLTTKSAPAARKVVDALEESDHDRISADPRAA